MFVVDDDPASREILKTQLELEGYHVETFEGGEECLHSLSRTPYVICLDMHMPGLDGMETLKRIQKVKQGLPVVMVTSEDDTGAVVEAIKLGAFDYIVKPVGKVRLFATIKKAIEQYSLINQVEQLRGELKKTYSYKNIIGKSPCMKKLFSHLDKVIHSNITVFINGETGTGKELVARAIHYSDSGKRSFVAINCGAIPETLQESELFGHEKGAFTGAVDSKKGKLELADGGTIFLDELGEMSLSAQVKLLRFLQDKTFERVGGVKKIKIDARVISATNKDLKQAIAEKKFREDLYYRLMVYPITIPPLRERIEDIPLLCAHFLKKYESETRKSIKSIDTEAMEALLNYPWPGNIRQLENVIYRAMVTAEGDTIGLDCLPEELIPTTGKLSEWQKIDENAFREPEKTPSGESSGSPLQGQFVTLHEAEKFAILNALKDVQGDIPLAAKKLGVSRATFYRKIKKHRLSHSEEINDQS